MPALSRRLSLVVLLALLAVTLPAPRPAFAASLVVNSLADTDDGACTAAAGGCTLREAILAANASAAADTITFSLDGTVAPTSPLPELSGGGDTIDATSRAHKLVLSGQAMSAADPKVPSHGITISSANNTVRGLVIVGFPFVTTVVNGGGGIFISGPAASGNKIYDNWIGLGADGATAAPNQYAGVIIDDGASNNIIGGTAAGEPNVISGNTTANVLVQNISGTSNIMAGNRIVGNRIGTNSAGTATATDAPTSSLDAGVLVQRWARNTEIRANLIGGHSGNSFVAAIKISSDVLDAGSTNRVPRDTLIVGNRIGVTDAGVAIPNRTGIVIVGGARYGALNTQIGDPDDLAGGRNYIAGNSFRGIEIEDSQVAAGNTLIAGNYIGLAPNGSPVANGTVSASTGGEGVWIGINASNGATRTTLGPGNVIAASRLVHLRIRSSGNIVIGNRIGTSPDGLSTSATSFSTAATVGFGSGALSVFVENGAGNRIGGPTAADRNVIASGGISFGGTGAPILIDPRGAGASNNFCFNGPCATSGTVVEGNYLGVKANGNEPLISSATATTNIEGVRIRQSTGNQVRSNLIGGLGRGILLDTGANNNSFSDNLIGTNASGATSGPGVPNSQDGIRVVAGSGNTFTNNVIAFNARPNNFFPGVNAVHGVRVGISSGVAGATDNNQFIGNRLVDNGAASAGAGIYIQNSQRVRVSQTTTESHGEAGIVLNNANGGIEAPALTQPADTATTISGSAAGCGSGCTVELFTGPTSITDRNEGPVYLAAATTGAGGAFSVSLAGCLGWVTATVRDANGNTSPFSTAVDVSANTTCAPPTVTLSAATQASRTVVAGTSTTYVHTVSHTSPVARTYNVVLVSSQGWAAAPNTITLPANGSATLEVVVSVPLGTASGTSDSTTVRIVLPGTGVQSGTQTDTTTAQEVVQNPAAPAVSPGQVKPLTANQTSFTHTVTNTGDLAGDFTVVGPTLAPGSPASWSIASATLGKTRLNGGESTTLTIVVNNPPPLPGDDVTFSFRVAVTGGTQTDPVVDTIDVPVVRSFTFTGPTPASATTSPGNTVSFSYTLQNTGNAADTFQVSVPTPPAGITFAASPSTSFQLAAGASRTVTVSATVTAGVTPGTYTFTARAQAVGGTNPPPPAAIDRQGSVIVIAGGVPFFVGAPVVAPAEAAFGSATSVAITWSLRNNGNAAAPFSFAREGALPAGWTQTGLTSTCPSPVPATASGSSCTVTLTVQVPAGQSAGPRTLSIRATADNSANGSADTSAIGSAEVVVETVRGVTVSPGAPPSSPDPILASPGQVLTFTHTVRNTGNATDSFTVGAFQFTGLSWPIEVSPTRIDNLPRGESAEVTLVVTVPEGVQADLNNTVTVRARSVGDTTKFDTAGNAIRVSAVDAADLSPGTTQTTPVSTTVTFTHTLTNTGSTTLSYRLEATNSNAAWDAPLIEPAGPIGPLAPGATAQVTVRVTVPADASGGTSNTTTVNVYDAADADPATPLDTELDITRVGDPFDVLITPNNQGVALPDSTVVFTHTVTNIGINRDSYRLTTAEAGNVPAAVAPDLLDLGPGESQTISVTVRLPIRLAPDDLVFVRVTATSLTEPAVSGSATDEITIRRVAGLDLSAGQVRGVAAGGELRLDSLTLANRGNARDTFTLSFEDVTGSPGGLVMQATPSTITLDPDGVFRGIALRATVPNEVPTEQTRRVRVVARSSFDPSVVDSVIIQIVYLAEVQPPPAQTRLYLPALAR